ncbi:sensor histidine kinase [Profundibacter amoris]|uniref:histidine kinase n=1 Tax=Profundibacter amoris TaxID=2171755 RepID=A0A347UGL2_9RHOB|nr:ATP-binding protein [Profundibacter amoris]AXX97990.1 HAMP domain-containing protein [Profundibacter amoris]
MNLPAPILRLHHWIGASLQRKLVMAIGILLVLVSALFLLVVSAFYKERLVTEHARASMQINHVMQAALENAMLKRDIPGLKAILQDMGKQPAIARVMILNPEFEVRFSSDPTRLNLRLDEDIIKQALDSQSQQSLFLQSEQFGEVLRSINPVQNQTACSTCHGELSEHPVNGLLVVDYKAQSIRHEATASALKLAALGLLVIAVVCLGIWFALVRLVITPLGEVEKATKALSQGQFDRQVPVRGNDEIARLGSSFNRMSDQLRQSLQQLRQSEHFLQALIDAIPDGIRVIDPDFRILKANAAYCAQVGQPMDQVVGNMCYASSHGRDTQCPYTMVRCPVVELCQQNGDQMTAQDKHIGVDGNELYVEVSSARVDMMIDGKTVPCVVESIRNLDEQAKISQQQRLSEIGLLAAGVAHEIYNPLSSIDLGLTALQSDLEANEAAKTLEYFETIRTEIQNCIKITDSLLLLSAPAGNVQNLITLDEVVPETLSLLHYEAEQTGVTITHDIPERSRILGSDSDIRMLVINLAMNAIHAMPEGGNLHVTTRREDGNIVLTVSDQGVGIAPQDLSSIFMPFWSRRADASTGRGLGLSIVRAILDRNNAKIEVESTLGKGSTFYVRFPDADHEVQDGNA